jgi:outer membrane protein OmpA-like peptidoglycan-associated protein
MGYNPSYSKALKVKKGERYYLVVDNYTEAKGAFSLALHIKFPKVVPEQTESRDRVVATDVQKKPGKVTQFGKTQLTIVVSDSAGHPVKGSLDITGAKPGQVINADTSSFTLTLNPRVSININCNSLGYMFTQMQYTSPDTATNATLSIMLSPVREHQSIVLKNIKFQEGVAIFLPSSQNDLMNLIEFMNNNPNVHILIKGFVNDPGSDNSSAAKKLSKQRAQAVYDFLAVAKIEKKRMDYKGLGNENMLFPKPATPAQAEANRRVEIEIVK